MFKSEIYDSVFNLAEKASMKAGNATVLHYPVTVKWQPSEIPFNTSNNH